MAGTVRGCVKRRVDGNPRGQRRVRGPSTANAYAVLSFGGFLGMGDKLFAIPWRALQIDPPNHRFILDVDKETLESAPGFDKDHWPSMADEQWAREIHTYYKANPYWD